MDVLNNVTAPNSAPTSDSTIDQTAPHQRAIVDVSNQPIYWQVKTGPERSQADWTPPQGSFMPPGSRRAPTSGPIYGFRFWAAIPSSSLPVGALQAQVTVTLV